MDPASLQVNASGVSPGDVFPVDSKLKKEELSDLKFVVAIDGTASSGKSTTAKILAQRLGFTHLDTGAMLRVVEPSLYRQRK